MGNRFAQDNAGLAKSVLPVFQSLKFSGRYRPEGQLCGASVHPMFFCIAFEGVFRMNPLTARFSLCYRAFVSVAGNADGHIQSALGKPSDKYRGATSLQYAGHLQFREPVLDQDGRLPPALRRSGKLDTRGVDMQSGQAHRARS